MTRSNDFAVIRWISVALAALPTACGTPPEQAPKERTAALSEGIVARVGSDLIDGRTVRSIADAQKIDVVEARSRAISDALLAAGSLQLGLASAPTVVVEQRAVLAEALLRKVKAEAASTPSSDEEIERITARHWLELNRPEARRTVHAVVRVSATDSVDKRKEAFGLAQHIASAVQGRVDPDQFIEAANSVPAKGLEVVAEKLGPVTADGRVADLEKHPDQDQSPQTFNKDFVAAVVKLKTVGEQSPPVFTDFGWHVIMLTGVQPAQVYSKQERSQLLREEIVTERAKQAISNILQEHQRRTDVQVERNAMTLMQTVRLIDKDPG